MRATAGPVNPAGHGGARTSKETNGMKLYSHLNFGGNCEEAFRVYEKHLGGRITMLLHFRDAPQVDMPPGTSPDAVIHVRMEVAGGLLVGNDVPRSHFQPMRSTYLFLMLDSVEEAERIYQALMDGGEASIPLSETFFAPRFAQLRDRFGTLWTIIHERKG
jgi:PhnB protein